MTVYIKKGTARGTVKAPPAKSFAHRMLICAALADSPSVIRGIYESEDVLATVDCARALCADIDIDKKTASVVPSEGTGGDLLCRESGSTLRFFIPLCLMSGQKRTLKGSARLFERPLGVYERLCREQGLTFEKDGGSVTVCGAPDLSRITVDGSVSSQFITGLMLAAPLTGKDSRITIQPPVVSRPYIDITRAVMKQFGVDTVFENENTLLIPGAQRYRGCECEVEGDWSNAAFLYTLGAFGSVRVTGLDRKSVQGDRVFPAQLRKLKKGAAKIDITDCPDNGPALIAAAAAFHGGTLTGTSRLAAKESDRGAAMAEELRKFGAEIAVYGDKIEISGGIKAPAEPLYGHNDHRIVMALSVLLTLTGGELRGAGAVNKSYPGFFEDLEKLGIEVEYGT